ncbi:MAG: hypothetical protein LBG80_17160 [Bacteroidales bacterium]|jgi:hypothetical protein|nr:hypothetical protein [Bacteroidales bacterium]
MGKFDYSEDYRKSISSLTDEELVKKYFEREDYNENYINLLISEINHRKIPIEELTSKETAMQALILRKSDKELQDIYNDLDCDKEMQLLAKQESIRRGLPIDTLEKEKKIAMLKQGVQGKHIVAGYLFSILGGLIGLIIAIDYLSSKEKTAEGVFYKYNKETRKSARGMLIAFVISSILFIMINL